jgi:magnesium-transporting ATPase (P-type)
VALVWAQVNAIMDLMAALALATELPTPDLLLRMPYGRYDQLINGHMWRNIMVQSAYQVFYSGPFSLFPLLMRLSKPLFRVFVELSCSPAFSAVRA